MGEMLLPLTGTRSLVNSDAMHVTFKIWGALKSLASTSTRRIPLQLQHQRNHGITIATTISRKAADTVALL
jgi:hypothetical protein